MKYVVQYVYYKYNFDLLSADVRMVSINDFYKLNDVSDFMWRKHYMHFILNGYVITGSRCLAETRLVLKTYFNNYTF